MKKIRQNTFETNSSSTHSLTVNISDPIFVEGTLYPDRLHAIEINDDECKILICSDTLSKLAYYLHFLKDNENPETTDYVKTIVKYIEDQFKLKIDWNFNNKFNHDDDEGRPLFYFNNSINGIQHVKDALDLITNDTKKIIDSNYNW